MSSTQPLPINAWYSCCRVWSGEGYNEKPSVDDRFLFALPPFRQYSGRDVFLNEQRWELWSPNSSETPFYPGVADPTWSGALPVSQNQRRYDGHLGRFDCTVSPQCYSGREPWLAFIRRPASLTAQERSEWAEHWPLTNHWTCSKPGGGTMGSVDSQLAVGLRLRCNDVDRLMAAESDIATNEPGWWSERPRWPTMEDVPSLGGEVQFDWAVDQVARVQRGLRIRVAWIVMASARRARSPSPTLHELRVRPIAKADNRYIGVWMNGCQEVEGLWLLALRAPCYLIHEYIEGVDYPVPVSDVPVEDHRMSSCVSTFCHGTLATVQFTVEVNPFEDIEKRQGIGLARCENHWIAPQRTYAELERKRSSSWYQGWSRVQGYIGIHGSQKGDVVNDVWDNGPGGRYYERYKAIEAAAPVTPVPVPPVILDFPYKEPTLLVLDPQRMLWVECPPVMGVEKGKSWEIFWEDLDGDNNSCMIKHAHAPKGHAVRYDRARMRTLYFFSDPDRCTSELSGEMFGCPAPRLKYFSRSERNHAVLRPYKPSVWMYRTLMPAKGTVGAVAKPPSVDLLPPLSKTGKERWEIQGSGGISDTDDDDDGGRPSSGLPGSPPLGRDVQMSGVDDARPRAAAVTLPSSSPRASAAGVVSPPGATPTGPALRAGPSAVPRVPFRGIRGLPVAHASRGFSTRPGWVPPVRDAGWGRKNPSTAVAPPLPPRSPSDSRGKRRAMSPRRALSRSRSRSLDTRRNTGSRRGRSSSVSSACRSHSLSSCLSYSTRRSLSRDREHSSSPLPRQAVGSRRRSGSPVGTTPGVVDLLQ